MPKAGTRKSVKELLNMDKWDFLRLSESDLRKAAQTLVDAANKRIKRGREAGIGESTAFDAVKKSGREKFSISGKTSTQLREEFFSAKKFMEDPTSTIKGAKKEEHNLISKFKEKMSASKKAKAEREKERTKEPKRIDKDQLSSMKKEAHEIENERKSGDAVDLEGTPNLFLNKGFSKKFWGSYNKFIEQHPTALTKSGGTNDVQVKIFEIMIDGNDTESKILDKMNGWWNREYEKEQMRDSEREQEYNF